MLHLFLIVVVNRHTCTRVTVFFFSKRDVPKRFTSKCEIKYNTLVIADFITSNYYILWPSQPVGKGLPALFISAGQFQIGL